MARRAAEPPLTAEQLRLGLRQIRRPDWPDDLAAVLADPRRGPLVRGAARQLSRQSPTAGNKASPSRYTPAVPPTPLHPPAPRSVQRMSKQRFDAKRAAANDLDD